MSTPAVKWGLNINIRVRRRTLYPTFVRISEVCWSGWKKAILQRLLIRGYARAAPMSGRCIAGSCARRMPRINGR
jgi:hypothetical protein